MRTSGGANLKLPRLILFHSYSESFRLSSDFFIYGAGRNCLFCVELTLNNPNLHFLLFFSVIKNLLVPFSLLISFWQFSFQPIFLNFLLPFNVKMQIGNQIFKPYGFKVLFVSSHLNSRYPLEQIRNTKYSSQIMSVTDLPCALVYI